MNFYSLIVSFSIIVLVIFIKKKSKIDENLFWKIVFYTTVFSFCGAKIFHLLENLNFYLLNPNLISLVKGYSIIGAICFGYITLLHFENSLKVNLEAIKINLFLALPLIQFFGRIGNITNQELLPFSYYEMILNLLNFIFLYVVYKNKKHTMVYFYFLNYGLIRIFIEILKGHFGFLFLMSVLMAIYGFFMLFKLRLKV